MEWTPIENCGGATIEAIDFADGVLVRDPDRFGMAFAQGWRVVDRGDMDGPGLRKRKGASKVFSIKIVEEA